MNRYISKNEDNFNIFLEYFHASEILHDWIWEYVDMF